MKRLSVLFIALTASATLTSLPLLAQNTMPLQVNKPFKTQVQQQQIQNSDTQDSKTVARKELSPEENQLRMKRLADQWGLTVEDWQRVEELQKGPRKYWSPNLDPLTLLGVEATTDAERQRIAEIQVRIEVDRAQRELDYERAYHVAFKKAYVGQPLFKSSLTQVFNDDTQKLAVFVKNNCAACERQVQKLQKENVSFDVYMVDSNNDDQRIRNWAKLAKIDPDLVRSRQITLNHDLGTFKSVVGSKSVNLPATYRLSKASGIWLPVE